MIKIKYKVLVVLLAISLGGNLILLYLLNYKEENADQVFGQTVTRIQTDLIQLESSIKYQEENYWENDTHVIEKLDDVVESIGVAFDVADRTGNLSNEVNQTLWDLHIYFTTKFKKDTGYPNAHLSANERIEFIRLGENLRKVGWRMNQGYSSDWSSFYSKAKELLG